MNNETRPASAFAARLSSAFELPVPTDRRLQATFLYDSDNLRDDLIGHRPLEIFKRRWINWRKALDKGEHPGFSGVVIVFAVHAVLRNYQNCPIISFV
jgi:hypothetical protein